MISLKIFIVEDEMIIAANIALQLSKLGYEVTGIEPTGEAAITHLKNNRPDLILLDIQLKGKLNGIDLAKRVQNQYAIPIIYLTANTDDFYFNQAKETKPAAFISKPFKNIDLQRAIELAANQSEFPQLNGNSDTDPEASFILESCIFVKHHEKMVKIAIEKIKFIEADRNYCRIYAKDKEFLLVMSLKELDKKLPEAHFMRIHRSFIVNLSKIDEVAKNHLVLGRKVIPLSKSYKGALLKRLQTI